MARFARLFTCALPALLSMTACDLLGPKVCTADSRPGIVVEITDAATGAPIAQNAVGTVRDGVYADSLRPHGFTGTVMTSRHAAAERAGRYALEVQHAGYQAWSASNVQVTRGECHVNTRTLQARLQPVP